MRGTLYAVFCFLMSVSAYGQKISTTLYQDWTDGAWGWQNTRFDTLTYNTKGLLINKLERLWSPANNAWMMKVQHNYTYTNDGLLKQDVTQARDSINNTWQNLVMVSNAYNTATRLDTVLTRRWVNGDWQKSDIKIYTFDSTGYLVKQLEQKWNATSAIWANTVLFEFTNNTTGNVTGWLDYQWDTVGLTWQKRGKNSITYNALYKSTGNVSQYWAKGDWENNVQGINSYDANGYLIKAVGQLWNAKRKVYVNTTQRTYTNNSNGTVNSYVAEKWKETDGAVISKQMVSYTYY